MKARATCWLAVFLASGTAHAQVLDRQPYLQMSTPDSVVITWRTDVPAAGRLRVGTAPGALTRVINDASMARQHELRVTGLLPGTRYFYDVGTPDAVLAGGDAAHHFTTPPPVGTQARVRAWILGDSGTGGSGQQAVRDAMLAYTGRDAPRFMLHVGDMAYNSGTDAEFTTRFFDVYADILRSTVTWPALGNHEGASSDSATQTGPYYEAYALPAAAEAGGVPSGTEAYYAFDDANVHYVVLDSHDSPRAVDGAMLTWLRADLAATSADWIIALWHHPPYSKGTHDSDTETPLIQMRENALPILEESGVDLVLTGHSHIYERSFLVDGVYAVSTQPSGTIKDNRAGDPAAGPPYVKAPGNVAHDGTVHIVAGHGGASLGRISIHPIMHASEVRFGSCILDIQGNRLSVVNVRDDGVLSDAFTILKGNGLVITAPNGAERFAEGATVTIRWTTLGDIPRVTLRYTPDDGDTWLPLDTVDNTGTYTWTLPANGTSAMRVRVESAADASVFDESNATFAVAADAVPFGATWRFDDTGVDPGAGWNMPAFDDGAWAQGPAQLGYGEADEATELANRDPNDASVYFRHAFMLAAPVETAWLDVLYDDGVAVFINGVPLLSRNVADGLGHTAYASAASADNALASAVLGAGHPLVVGRNVIAVVVKQADATSSDVSFNLRLRVAAAAPVMMDAGTPPDAALPDAAQSDAAVHDGAVVDGAVLDGAVLDGAVADASITDAAVADAAVRDAATADASERDAAVPDAAARADAAPGDTGPGEEPVTPGRCGCDVVPAAESPGPLLLVAGLVLARARRQRNSHQ